jgi:hypothetical protein
MKVVLLDLDETLIEEHSAAVATFEATAAFAETTDHRLTDRVGLITAARVHARALWAFAPTYDYCLRIGISSTEGLWCRFEGDDVATAALRRWSPTGVQPGQRRWKSKVSPTALWPTLLLNDLPPDAAPGTASSQMWNLPSLTFESITPSGSSRTAHHVFSALSAGLQVIWVNRLGHPRPADRKDLVEVSTLGGAVAQLNAPSSRRVRRLGRSSDRPSG